MFMSHAIAVGYSELVVKPAWKERKVSEIPIMQAIIIMPAELVPVSVQFSTVMMHCMKNPVPNTTI